VGGIPTSRHVKRELGQKNAIRPQGAKAVNWLFTGGGGKGQGSGLKEGGWGGPLTFHQRDDCMRVVEMLGARIGEGQISLGRGRPDMGRRIRRNG